MSTAAEQKIMLVQKEVSCRHLLHRAQHKSPKRSCHSHSWHVNFLT